MSPESEDPASRASISRCGRDPLEPIELGDFSCEGDVYYGV